MRDYLLRMRNYFKSKEPTVHEPTPNQLIIDEKIAKVNKEYKEFGITVISSLKPKKTWYAQVGRCCRRKQICWTCCR